jgi:DNA-binding IclR family transcriptional regulator
MTPSSASRNTNEGTMAAEPMPTRATAGDRKFVTALARGLDVLRCFGPRDRWLANQEIAKRTGLAKPTVTRLAYTLVRTGHLRYSESLNKYALGGSSRSLGFSALAQMDIRRIARPLMQQLSEHTKGAVHLSVSDRLSMVLIDTYRNPASFFVDIGSRLPMATTSIGRAYLCALPPADRKRLLDDIRQAHAEEWPRIKKAIDQAMAEYEKYGFCIALGEWRREVHGIAVPLVPSDSSEPVVFSCSGASFQLEIETLKKDIGPRLLTLAGNVRSALASE